LTALRILPFTALVPTRELQHRIPTYGSGKLPQSELEALAQEEALSYIRIVKPQFLDPSIEQGTNQFYEASKAHLDKLALAGALSKIEDAMFLYEQVQPGILPLRGIILAVGAENCADGTVKKHENVIQSKAGRLVKHIDVLNSISEPVLLTQKLPANIKDWLHTPRTAEPLVETTDALGFVHRLWSLSKNEQSLVVDGFGMLDSLYIADGHHRVALGETTTAMNAVEKLEVTRIESGIIRGLMGIENTSHDARISFMRGDTPLQKMKWIIDQGECDCVFVLPANSFDQVEAVADQNLTMPPKSTWIEPKLLTGFVSQQFD